MKIKIKCDEIFRWPSMKAKLWHDGNEIFKNIYLTGRFVLKYYRENAKNNK